MERLNNRKFYICIKDEPAFHIKAGDILYDGIYFKFLCSTPTKSGSAILSERTSAHTNSSKTEMWEHIPGDYDCLEVINIDNCWLFIYNIIKNHNGTKTTHHTEKTNSDPIR